MALFRYRQKAPAQRLVLYVVLAQSQGGDRLGHLVTKVEGVRRIDLLPFLHLFEKLEWIGALQEQLSAEDMQLAALSVNAVIRVRQTFPELTQGFFAEFPELRIPRL